jgi:hypothetical protein
MDSWCTEESSSKKKRRVASEATLQLIRDRAEQDANLDRIVRESSHRREIMMAQRIINENTLCLSGVDPCESCQKELDSE